MDPIDVLKVFIKLEKDIAAFYKKLKNISSIGEIVRTYEKMEQQSSRHAERIMQDYKSFRIHDLDIAPLIILHNHVKKNLLEEIKNESNILYILQKLADSEEQLGNIYKSIAVHYKKNARKYMALGEAIDKIGDEEYSHRDVILKDIQREAERLDVMSQSADDSEPALSSEGYKAFQNVLQQLKINMSDLNLRENEEDVIKAAISNAEQALFDNHLKASEFVTKCREVLRLQKHNQHTDLILKLLDDVQISEGPDMKIVE